MEPFSITLQRYPFYLLVAVIFLFLAVSIVIDICSR